MTPAGQVQNILELGSGTGLLGIAAAHCFPAARVYITDVNADVPAIEVWCGVASALTSGEYCAEQTICLNSSGQHGGCRARLDGAVPGPLACSLV